MMLLNEGLAAFGTQGQVQGWHLEVLPLMLLATTAHIPSCGLWLAHQ